jgi:hypothetical protein
MGPPQAHAQIRIGGNEVGPPNGHRPHVTIGMLEHHQIGAIPLPAGNHKSERLPSKRVKRMRDPDLRRSDYISSSRQLA